jgi:hypothetical protein
MIDREPSAVPTGDRGEFYVEVPTLEEGATIGLSATDALSESGPAFRWNALIQVGKGPYTCAYLNDEGLRRFRDAIDSYLSTPNEGGKVIA